MSTQVPQIMFVNYFSPFVLWYNSIIKDTSCLSTVAKVGSTYSVNENTILSKTEDMSETESSSFPTLDSGSSNDKSITWSDFVVSMNNDIAIGYARISIEGGTASSLVGVSESKLPVELESGKAWQASSEP